MFINSIQYLLLIAIYIDIIIFRVVASARVFLYHLDFIYFNHQILLLSLLHTFSTLQETKVFWGSSYMIVGGHIWWIIIITRYTIQIIGFNLYLLPAPCGRYCTEMTYKISLLILILLYLSAIYAAWCRKNVQIFVLNSICKLLLYYMAYMMIFFLISPCLWTGSKFILIWLG